MATAGSYQDHNQKTLQTLSKGDMVEFERGLYSHFGVYQGDGLVIHLTGDMKGSATNAPKSPSSFSGQTFDKARVCVDKFWDIVGNGKASKNNTRDGEFEPLDPDEIVKKARSMLGEQSYNLLMNNCEHFATWCRYGRKVSDQVNNMVETVIGFVRGIAQKLVVKLASKEKKMLF